MHQAEFVRTSFSSIQTLCETHAALQSHPRQWVVSSDAFYTQHKTWPSNPTNGSWWMVQILSKGSEVSTHSRGWDYIRVQERSGRGDLNKPPTPVGGIDR